MELCPPAIIYLLFSIIQIIIDTVKGLYNTALVKILVMVVVTFLLNLLCKQGLGVVSWIIVFIPFILMTVIVSIVLYVFGLDAASGNIKKDNTVSTDAAGNIVIHDPNYLFVTNPVKYSNQNIIIPNPQIKKL